MTPADCDVGASPQMSKGNILAKMREKKDVKSSPLMSATAFKLGKKKN